MEYKNVSKNCIKEWYILRSIGFIFLLLGFVLVLMIETTAQEERVAKNSCLIVYGIILLWMAIYAYIFPVMQYNRLKYRINASRIEKRSGVIFLRQQFVPFVRIQHAEIFRGVTDRIFKMSTVVIYTAGSAVRIQNLSIPEAEDLILHIKKLLDNEARGDVND